ncbi:MAG: sodium-dependent dicarboxylate transporter 2/3/5 [Oceanicoccus sp.]|jgi:sodium-dependent dicarboxylate transporter 2/3/5
MKTINSSILNWIGERKGLIVAILVSIVILLLPQPEPIAFGDDLVALTADGQKMLALLALVMIVFVTEALPVGALVFVVYSWLVFLNIGEPEEVVKLFGHDAPWFLLGALMIASVLVKHGIHKRVLVVILRFAGYRVRNIVFGIVSFCAIAAAFIADHTIAAMMLPVALAMINSTGGFDKNPNLSKLLLFAIAYGASIGGLGTPSGGGRNVVMIGFLKDYFDVSIHYGAWMIMALPILLILIPFVVFVLMKTFPPERKELKSEMQEIQSEIMLNPMRKSQWVVIAIFLMILLMLITQGESGLGVIVMFGALVYLVFGLAEWKDYQKINWGIGLLYFGAVAFGSALRATGAATWLAANISLLSSSVLGISGGTPLIGVSVVFTSMFSQFVSDGPAVASVGPVFLEMARLSGTDPVSLGIAVAISSAFAFALVIGTPPNAIIYGTGYVKGKDFLKAGIPLYLISIIILMIVVKFWWLGVLGVGLDGFH